MNKSYARTFSHSVTVIILMWTLLSTSAFHKLPFRTRNGLSSTRNSLLALNRLEQGNCNMVRHMTKTSSPEKPVPNLNIELPTNDNSPNLLRIRHSTAHVMAMAVQKLFPKVKVTIGPWIDNGFYYDFHVPDQQLSVEDLKKIKKEMDRIIKQNHLITREEVTVEEARARIEAANEPFKLEILQSILDRTPNSPISIYHIGKEWWDLCAGPHVESTGQIPSSGIELQTVAGAYWRGDEANPMLQRIYGTAWETKEQLEVFNFRQAEAKRRDHRTLGKQLNLFSIQEDAGGGLVFWHAKGALIRRLIEDYWKTQHLQNGYEMLYTPHIANLNLWKTSGHHDFYRADMFQTMTVDQDQYQIKPMNCPFHCLLYKDTPKSYRDLPIRWAELGTVYRYERSGTLHGLFRVRGFTQDDAHIFCLPEQLEDEILGVLTLIEKVLTQFGFRKYEILLSTRPKDSVGSDEIWEKATTALTQALTRKQWPYTIDEGGGAFYGPKIDVKIQDMIGRKWQLSTVQCDFNLPERFQLEYVSAHQPQQQQQQQQQQPQPQQQAAKCRPIMIHRAIFGSLERFFGILIEHTAGEFPFWLAPVQLRLLPVIDTPEIREYCARLQAIGQKEFGLRMEIDHSAHRINKQIRIAELEKIPLTAIVGMQEMQSDTISLRMRKIGDVGTYTVKDVFAVLQDMLRSSSNTELSVDVFAGLEKVKTAAKPVEEEAV